ncbi:DUF4760 domain-containing protein [Sphingopyxis sp.]|uniref:DUF4760 domain-containing protein n=1 Tax=Sphingopyxis sp. TaxID=1908224 RepID=UPI0035B3A2C4
MIETLAEWKDAAPATGAIIALLSALVALGVFHYTRKVNRRRATLDMVLKTFMDDSGRERYNKFKTLMHRHKDCDDAFDIMAFADPDSPITEERQILRAQINEYELIALGIRRSLFDEKIYKLWFQNQFVRDFESLEDFISKVREKRPSVFCEYVWLYNRWKKAPHPENAPSRWKVAWWGITNNQPRLKAFSAMQQD